MKALLTAILLALLFSSAALCQSARDVTASLPVGFTNILKGREYTGSSAISERQFQKLNTQSDALPFFADGQVDSGDDVSVSFSGFYADADGNPSSDVATTTQFLLSLTLTGDDADKYHLTNPSVSISASISPQDLKSSDQPEAVAFRKAFENFKLIDSEINVSTKIIESSLGYYPLRSDSVAIYQSPEGFTIYATKGVISKPTVVGSGRQITLVLTLVGNDNYTLSVSQLSYCSSCGSVILPYYDIYVSPDTIVDYGTTISVGVKGSNSYAISGYVNYDPKTGTGTGLIKTQQKAPLSVGTHVVTGVATGTGHSKTVKSFNVTVLPISLSIKGQPSIASRPYDATANLGKVTLPTLDTSNLINSDTASLAFSIDSSAVRPSAGTYQVLFLAHLFNPNYSLADSVFSVPFTITPSEVSSVSLSGNELPSTTKVYDGTTTLPLPSDGIPIPDAHAHITAARFSSPSAGSHSIIVDIAADANYTLQGGVSSLTNVTYPTKATITPKQLSVSDPIFSSTKVYDGTTSAPDFATPPSLIGVVDGDDVTLSFSAAFDNPDAGPRTITTSLSLAGSDAANYTLPTSSFPTKATITPKQLSVSDPIFSSTSKVYDGTTSAPDFASPPSLIGVVDGDEVSLAFAASFDAPDAGSRTITTSLSLTGSDAANYTLPTSSFPTKGTIAQRSVTPNDDAFVPSRVYDATTAIERRSVTPPTLNNVIPTDSVSAMVVSAEVDNPAPGLRTATISLALVGPDAANYTLGDNTSVTAPITITQLDKTPVRFVLRGSLPLTYGHSTIGAIPDADIFVDTDPIISGSLSVNFHDSGITLPAGDNIVRLLFTPQDTLVYAIADSTIAISVNPVTLSLVGSFSVNGKLYDGTTSVTDSSFVLPSISGVLDGDDVHLNVDSISFASKNIGDNLITTSLSLTGSDANNYSLPASSLSTQATISPKQLSVSEPIFSSTSKVYDGTTSAPDFATPPSLIGVVDGDDVSLSFSAAFDSPYTGSRTITTSLSLTGSDAHNYTLPASSLSTKASITPKQLSVSTPIFSSTSKVYDGTTSAPDFATPPSLIGVVDGDDVSLSFSAAFDSPDAGSRTITTSLSLTGSDANNYSLPASSLSTKASISPKQLSVSEPIFSSTSKVYDGTTSAPDFATPPSLIGVVDGDDVTLSFSAAFDSPDAGARTIVVSFSLLGSDANNYLAPDAYSVAGEITEPSPTPNPEPDPTPTPDPIVATATILSATDYGYCATDTITIALNVESGAPTSYSLTFADAIFPDVINAVVPDDFILHIPVTSSDNFGSVDASLVLHDADNNVSSTAITLTLVRRPDASRLGIKFGNTLFVNNYDNAFSAYQWTADGIDIPGASNQFYFSPTLSPAVYTCRLTTSSGDVLLSCPLTINSPSSATTLSVAPNPVRSGESMSIRLGNADTTLSVELYNTNGALCESHVIPNGGSFPVSSPQGAYVVSVSTSNTTSKVKITIK